MVLRLFQIAVLLHLVGCTHLFAFDDASIAYQQQVRPFLEERCIHCHGADVQEGNVRLDQLSNRLEDDRVAAEVWHEMLNVLNDGSMPPETEPALDGESRNAVTAWITAELRKAAEARQHTDGRVVLRRLNRREYQYTMTDLLGLEMDYVRDLPPDAISSDGFENDGSALQMSSLQLEYYLATARQALDRVIVSGEMPAAMQHSFSESKIDGWLGNAQLSNRLGRQQEFLAKIDHDYPDQGEFVVRVQATAEIKSNTGFPLLELSVGYRPDTEILLREFPLVEITSSETKTYEFRGRLEDFPLPVRGQGKYPGLVIRVRNVYDDGTPPVPEQKDENQRVFYADEPLLPTLTIGSVEFIGNAYESWPPAAHRSILFEADTGRSDDEAYVREVLRRFITRAFRRPATDNEVDFYLSFFQSIRGEFPSWEEAVREALAMVLIAPDFLYLVEPAGDERRELNDWELATRLSYFLWSTMPDESLMKRAANGTLHESLVLTEEVERMLADERAMRFIDQFAEQWLSLNRIDNVAIDKEKFPQFQESLKAEMCKETKSFMATLMKENLSVLQMLSANFTMLNEPLAKHYGLASEFGREFRKVDLDASSHRGGLLSQASILLIHSTGSESHPIRRAVWLRDRLLNDPPSPPPPNVPTLDQADPEFRTRPIREQLEIHRSNEACANCHRNIDPWGLVLENYDAVGLWRESIGTATSNGPREDPIYAVDILPSGQEIVGVEGLKEYLLENRSEDFTRSLAVRLLSYALGRTLDFTDNQAVDEIVNECVEQQFRMRELIQTVVHSRSFQTK